MDSETRCPECLGECIFILPNETSIPCYLCKGAGVLIEESAYRHLTHSIFSGICNDCAGTGCGKCNFTGQCGRQIPHAITRLIKSVGPQRKSLGLAATVDGKKAADLRAGRKA